MPRVALVLLAAAQVILGSTLGEIPPLLSSEAKTELLLLLESGRLTRGDLAGAAAPLAAGATSTGGRRLAQIDTGPLRAVQLFRKPAMSTGQLVAVKEGMAVLRAQTEPLAIVSAVGPTRTGKSSILGRASCAAALRTSLRSDRA